VPAVPHLVPAVVRWQELRPASGSPWVARVRRARLLTILSSISRIVPVRGREDAAAAQVRRGRCAVAREAAARGNAARGNAAKAAERVTGSRAARLQVGERMQRSVAPAARRPRWENDWRSSLLSLDDSPTKPSTPGAAIFTAS
jgi:hypothetical protein